MDDDNVPLGEVLGEMLRQSTAVSTHLFGALAGILIAKGICQPSEIADQLDRQAEGASEPAAATLMAISAGWRSGKGPNLKLVE